MTSQIPDDELSRKLHPPKPVRPHGEFWTPSQNALLEAVATEHHKEPDETSGDYMERIAFEAALLTPLQLRRPRNLERYAQAIVKAKLALGQRVQPKREVKQGRFVPAVSTVSAVAVERASQDVSAAEEERAAIRESAANQEPHLKPAPEPAWMPFKEPDDDLEDLAPAALGESPVRTERAVSRERAGVPERAKLHESPANRERAVSEKRTEDHARAVSSESTKKTERAAEQGSAANNARAVSSQRTVPDERAEKNRSTVQRERPAKVKEKTTAELFGDEDPWV